MDDHERNLLRPEEVQRIEGIKADMRRPLSEKYPWLRLAIGGLVLIVGVALWVAWRGWPTWTM